jgi:transcriptional regulator with XRE-family HTH domain
MTTTTRTRKLRGARLSPRRAEPVSSLQSRRIELNLTQDQVADALGITARHVGNIEAARVGKVRDEWLAPLARVLQVEVATVRVWAAERRQIV